MVMQHQYIHIANEWFVLIWLDIKLTKLQPSNVIAPSAYYCSYGFFRAPTAQLGILAAAVFLCEKHTVRIAPVCVAYRLPILLRFDYLSLWTSSTAA